MDALKWQRSDIKFNQTSLPVAPTICATDSSHFSTYTKKPFVDPLILARLLQPPGDWKNNHCMCQCPIIESSFAGKSARFWDLTHKRRLIDWISNDFFLVLRTEFVRKSFTEFSSRWALIVCQAFFFGWMCLPRVIRIIFPDVFLSPVPLHT